jgi:hypothetical protein
MLCHAGKGWSLRLQFDYGFSDQPGVASIWRTGAKLGT